MMQTINAVIKEGHRVASGQTGDSPYPQGSIEMQASHFKKHGVDLDNYYKATLNLSIAPYTFKLVSPDATAEDVKWAEGFAAEDFSFSRCEVMFSGTSYDGLIYYPHPETKIGHFHDSSLIEVITHYIPNIEYGDKVELKFNDASIRIE